MYHLIVTGSLAKHKVGSLITDPAEIEKLKDARGVVRVFEHLTHVGVAAKAAAANAAPASAPAAEPYTL